MPKVKAWPLTDVANTFRTCETLFHALGDPARQKIVLLLAEHDRLNVNQFTELNAPKDAAKSLKGPKSQRNDDKNGVKAEDFTQKSLPQTIRPNTTAVGELFRPSLS
jgi:hypothetical protein